MWEGSVEMVIKWLRASQHKSFCRETALALMHMEMALRWLKKRPNRN